MNGALVTMSRHYRLIACVPALASILALASGSLAASPPTLYRPSDSPGAVKGVGTESQDILSMSDQIVRDMLNIPELMNAKTPPRVIIDPSKFKNQSSEIIDKALITDRILVGLNRAAGGRVMFVSREDVEDVDTERHLKDDGRVDVGTTGRTRAMAGGDYMLSGRISTRDAVDPQSGVKSRFTQYSFRLVDLEYDTIVWSNLYEFKKETADNVVYR